MRPRHADAKAEMAEYSRRLKEAMAFQDTIATPPEVQDASTGVKAALQANLGVAQMIVDKVASGDIEGARRSFKTFDATFEALESKMSKVADAIETANRSLSERLDGDGADGRPRDRRRAGLQHHPRGGDAAAQRLPVPQAARRHDQGDSRRCPTASSTCSSPASTISAR